MMRFNLQFLRQNSLDEIRDMFASIPKDNSHIAIVGDFNATSPFEWPLAAKALSYLPKHVRAVTLAGLYSYTNHSYQRKTGTRFHGGGGGEIDVYTTEWYQVRRVGSLLVNFIDLLPTSVNYLFLNFRRSKEDLDGRMSYLRTSVASDFESAFKKIPAHITHFNFTQTDLTREESDELAKMFASIPTTVTSITVGNLFLGQRPLSKQEAILSAMHRDVFSLDLSHNRLFLDNDTSLAELFNKLPENLRSLSLADNHASNKTCAELSAIVSRLPGSLSALRLNGNGLSELSDVDLHHVLSTLPASIAELDLGENGLLFLETPQLTSVLSGLPLTVKKLRLSELDADKLTGATLATKLSCIPSHVEEFSLRDSKLLSLPMEQLVEGLSGLPRSIRRIDLSQNSLCQFDHNRLCSLFSGLPDSVSTLRLHRNNLSSLEVAMLRDAFSGVSKSGFTLDLRENGFDRLLYTRLNQLMGACPDFVILIEQNNIGIRNDGTLTVYAHGQNHALFKPKGRIRHQQQFAASIHETSDVVSVIFPFVGDAAARRIDQNELAKTLISSIPPKNITHADLEQSIEAVRYRFDMLNPGETRLDLSRCGLNRFKNPKILGNIFKQIPDGVHALSLRGNGFQFDIDSRAALIAALQDIKRNINYIDLSGHGFEQNSSIELAELFANLPETVTSVSLSHEKPLSPAHHIARCTPPASYQTLTAQTEDLMRQARILLDDYTKGDSAIWRFFYGHWNRHHTPEVAKIVKYIDKGLITNIDDVLSEFELINMPNEAGSLGKRLAFLFKKSLQQQHETTSFDNEGIVEMQAILR